MDFVYFPPRLWPHVLHTVLCIHLQYSRRCTFASQHLCPKIPCFLSAGTSDLHAAKMRLELEGFPTHFCSGRAFCVDESCCSRSYALSHLLVVCQAVSCVQAGHSLRAILLASTCRRERCILGLVFWQGPLSVQNPSIIRPFISGNSTVYYTSNR